MDVRVAVHDLVVWDADGGNFVTNLRNVVLSRPCRALDSAVNGMKGSVAGGQTESAQTLELVEVLRIRD